MRGYGKHASSTMGVAFNRTRGIHCAIEAWEYGKRSEGKAMDDATVQYGRRLNREIMNGYAVCVELNNGTSELVSYVVVGSACKALSLMTVDAKGKSRTRRAFKRIYTL